MMNMKLVGLLVAIVILLLGLVLVMGRNTTTPAPVVVAAPPAVEQPRPNPRAGSFKKSDPTKTYEWTTPDAPEAKR